MKFLHISNPLVLQPENITNDPIHIVMQFYIDKSPARQNEILACLHTNMNLLTNDSVCGSNKIILLNERIYSPAELGFNSRIPDCIQQINIGKRMHYKHAVDYAAGLTMPAYIAIANSDIFFDESVFDLRKSQFSVSKQCMAQLRYEFNPGEKIHKIFGPRYDSQDAWIFHTNNLPPSKFLNFGLGIPGCDNKIAYLLYCSGFDVINHPDAVRIYHYHTSQVRNYTKKDALPEPYACIIPYGIKSYMESLGVLSQYVHEMSFNDNDLLFSYLTQKLNSGEVDRAFVIPRISTVETNEACAYEQIFGKKQVSANRPQIETYLNSPEHINTLKNNAGIWFANKQSKAEYSRQYLAAFANCDMFGGWERWGNMYRYVGTSQMYLKTHIAKPDAKMFSSLAFDIFHYIHHPNPWTHALRGKRLLIISSFAKTMENQVDIRERIYGRDLFPDCTFLFLVPPQTQAGESAADFVDITAKFYAEIDALKGQYDVALVSCGGYGVPTVNHIYETGGSAIYVGGVLQMYFGILGNRWLKERPDMVRMYLNEHWKRPTEEEKPKGHQSVEGGCYW